MKRRPRNNDNGFEEWGGYMGAKIGKLEEQFAANAANNHFKESDLFHGISIFVNGRTNPSADELKRIMLTHGGVFHHYQRSNTSFVIASNLPDVKVRMMNCSKIIKAEWVMECLKAKRIIDYSSYLLVTNQRTTQPKLMFSKKSVESDCAINNETNSDDISLGLDAINNMLSIKHADNEDLFADEDMIDSEPDDTSKSNAEPLLKSVRDDILHSAKSSSIEAKPQEVSVNASEEIVKSFGPNKNQARTAVDPNFLSEFYNNSRLHHISAMGAKFKHLVSDWREKHDVSVFPERIALKNILPEITNVVTTKIVMHIDMDCFFVSVGLRNFPSLRGHPVAVTHSKGSDSMGSTSVEKQNIRSKELQLHLKRLGNKFNGGDGSEHGTKLKSFFEGTDSLSEIASCSYEARAMGVKNGMFVGAALKLCPNLKTIPYDFDGYQEVATKLYSIIAKYTLDIEAVSCDEMYVELSSLLKELKVDVMEFVKFIRNEIREATACPCSAGVGGNRLQARMATKKAKPDGQFYLQPDCVEEYFRDIDVSDLPGVGSSTNHKLTEMKLKLCGDLQLVSLARLQTEFGKKFGETLYQSCRGLDNRSLVYGQIRKSVSAEVNYGIRFTENSELETFLKQLCGEVRNRLMEINRKGKCITLKFMVRAKDAPTETSKFMGHGICDHLTKSVSLSNFTSELDLIYNTIIGIKNGLNVSPKELRGIGIQITKLDHPNSKNEKSNVLFNMFSKVAEKNQTNNSVGVVADGPKTDKENLVNLHVPTAIDKLPPTTVRMPTTRKKKTQNSSGNIKNSMLAMQMKAQNKLIADQNVENCAEQLDEAVLAELPEDIRLEVIRDFKWRMQQKLRAQKKLDDIKNGPEINKNNDTNKNAVVSEIIIDDSCVEIDEKAPKVKPGLSKFNVWIQDDWRKIVSSWITSDEIPEELDVAIILEHSREMIRYKRMADLYSGLHFLFQKIKIDCNNCIWHRIYWEIVSNVQEEMLLHYSAPLKIENSFECMKCCK